MLAKWSLTVWVKFAARVSPKCGLLSGNERFICLSLTIIPHFEFLVWFYSDNFLHFAALKYLPYFDELFAMLVIYWWAGMYLLSWGFYHLLWMCFTFYLRVLFIIWSNNALNYTYMAVSNYPVRKMCSPVCWIRAYSIKSHGLHVKAHNISTVPVMFSVLLVNQSFQPDLNINLETFNVW